MNFDDPKTRAGVEWPTVGLAAVIYGGWLALTYCHREIAWPLLALGGGWLLAWQMSLQHEVLHGHPTRWRRCNDALGFAPLTLWLPYPVYRRLHLRHHRDEHLTDPLEDPESFYLAPERFARLRRPARLWVLLCNTFFGRICLAALRSIPVFLWNQAKSCWRGEGAARRTWFFHLLGVAGVLVWLCGVCRMSLVAYVVLFVIPSRMLASVRAFAEHRAAATAPERTAIVEAAPVLGLLFLYNNLHAVHHGRPGLPWYRLPAVYRRHRDAIVAGNGGLVYRGYGDVMRRYLFTPHHAGPHPGFAAPRAPLPLPAMLYKAFCMVTTSSQRPNL